jgi:hypothetical protein
MAIANKINATAMSANNAKVCIYRPSRSADTIRRCEDQKKGRACPPACSPVSRRAAFPSSLRARFAGK